MEVFGEILDPQARSGRGHHRSGALRCRSRQGQRFPELPYVTLRLAYMACEYFNADLGLAIVRAEHQAFYRRVFLHETIAEPRFFPGLLKPVGLMAANFPDHARQGVRALSDDALDRLRAADVVRAPLGAGRCRPVRGHLACPAVLPDRRLRGLWRLDFGGLTRTAGPASRQPGRRFTRAALATSNSVG